MKRPYVICHAISTIDGRISGDDFYLKEMEPIHEANFSYRNTLDCDAVMNGTVTCAEIYADGMGEPATCKCKRECREDNILFKEGDKCCICIDPLGQLIWSSNYVDRPVMPKSHVVEVLTEKVSEEYIQGLKELGISYIFAGTDETDLELLLEKLSDYGIRRLLVTGGGTINYALLKNGLVDEVSVVISPIVAADKNCVSTFERSEFAGGNYGGALQLISVKELKDGSILLRYETVCS